MRIHLAGHVVDFALYLLSLSPSPLKYIEANKKKIEKQGLKLLPPWQSAMGLQLGFWE